MIPEDQLATYGQVLTGEETPLTLAKLERIQYLGKNKLRRLLDLVPLGDTKDCLTDLVKGVILGWAIQRGLVSEPAILSRFDSAITAQLEMYGGPEFVISMLEANAAKMSGLMARYYQAKAEILAIPEGPDAEDQVRAIDIEDVPARDLLP